MSALSELEMRILAELEEAGEENVPAMINTVMQPAGGASEVEDMRRALENLVRADFIRMSMDRDPSGLLRDLSTDESFVVIAELQSHLRFDGGREVWTDTRHSGPPYSDPFPYIVNTNSGKSKAHQILTERGWGWYLPDRFKDRT